MNIQRALEGAGDLTVHPTVSALHIPSNIPVSHTFIPFQSFSGIPIPGPDTTGNLRSRPDDNNNKTVVSVVAAVSGLCPALPVVSMQQHQHSITQQTVVAAPAIIPAVVTPVAVQAAAAGKLAPGMSLGPPQTTSNITLNCSVANLGPTDPIMALNSTTAKLPKLVSTSSPNMKSFSGTINTPIHPTGNCSNSSSNSNSINSASSNPGNSSNNNNNINPTPPSKSNNPSSSNTPKSNNSNSGQNLTSEQTDDLVKPVFKDGELVLEVECGQNKGILYLSKLCQGSKGPCISFQSSWLTPNEFQFVSGRETAKDWKRSIRHHGKSLKLLLAKGILNVHPTMCDCDGCRQGATLTRKGEKRRVPNGERKPRKPSSNNNNGGSCSSNHNNNSLINAIANSCNNNNGVATNNNANKTNSINVSIFPPPSTTTNGNNNNASFISPLSSPSSSSTSSLSSPLATSSSSSALSSFSSSVSSTISSSTNITASGITSSTTVNNINNNNNNNNNNNESSGVGSLGNNSIDKNDNHAMGFFRPPGVAIVPGQLSPGGAPIKPEMKRPGVDKSSAVPDTSTGLKPENLSPTSGEIRQDNAISSTTSSTASSSSSPPSSSSSSSILFSSPLFPRTLPVVPLTSGLSSPPVTTTTPLSPPKSFSTSLSLNTSSSSTSSSSLLLSVPSATSLSTSPSLSPLSTPSSSSSSNPTSTTPTKRVHSVLSMISNTPITNPPTNTYHSTFNRVESPTSDDKAIDRLSCASDSVHENDTDSNNQFKNLKNHNCESVKEQYSEVEDDNDIDVNGDDGDVSFDSSDEDDEVDESHSSRLEIDIEEESGLVMVDKSESSVDNLPNDNDTESSPKIDPKRQTKLILPAETSSSSQVSTHSQQPISLQSPSTTISFSTPPSSSSSSSSTSQSISSSSSHVSHPTSAIESSNSSSSSQTTSSLSSSSSSTLSPQSSSATMSVSTLPPAMSVASLPNIKSEHIWVPPTVMPNHNSEKQNIPLIHHQHPYPQICSPSTTTTTSNYSDNNNVALPLKIKSEKNNNDESTQHSEGNISKHEIVSETESVRDKKYPIPNNSGIHPPTAKENSNPHGFASILERSDPLRKEPGLQDSKPVVAVALSGSIPSSNEKVSNKDKDYTLEREKEEMRLRQKAKEERNRKEREREERREREKREQDSREAAEREQQRRRSEAERREREISRAAAAQAESISRHEASSSGPTLSMTPVPTLDPLGRPQGGVSEAAFSDYMRVLAASHGHSFLSPSPAAGFVHPMLQLRPQDPRFASSPLLNSLGSGAPLGSPIAGYPFPKEHPIFYPGAAGSSLLPHGFPSPPTLPQIHPLFQRPPYAPAAAQPPSVMEYQRSLAAAAAYGWPQGYPYLLSDLSGAASVSASSSSAAAAITSVGMKRPSTEFEVAVELNAKRMRLENCRPPDLGAQWDYFAAAAAAQRPQTSALPCGLESSSMDKMSESIRKRYLDYMNVPQAQATAAYLSALPPEYARPVMYQCACAEHRDDDIRLWQVEDVCKFLSSLDGCAVYTDHFREQRVDGRILVLLTTDHLTKTLGMKLGPAVLLYEAVAKKLQDLSKMQNCEACRSIAMSQPMAPMPVQL